MVQLLLATQSQVVQISTWQGVLGIAVVLIAIGASWGSLKTAVQRIDKDLDSVKTDVKDVRERFATLEGKTSKLFETHSPISLTKMGEKFLEESGFKEYVDKNLNTLMEYCSKDGALKTPYDVQQASFETFDKMHFSKQFEDKIKTYAFTVGTTPAMLRRVAAVYFRDICLAKLNMDVKDLDASEESR